MISERWLLRIWLAAAGLLVLIGSVLGTAFLVGEAYRGTALLSERQSAFILGISEFPTVVRRAIRESAGRLRGEPTSLLVDRTSVETPAWTRRFPAPEDPGYLLFAGLDARTHRNLVRLIRIADGAEAGHWAPDWDAIYQKSTRKRWSNRFTSRELLPLNPLLLEDGSIVFNTGNAVVRSAACATSPMWVLDHIGHHSVERGIDDSVWVPSIADEPYSDIPALQRSLRMDSLAHISLDGRLLENRSLATILEQNGLTGLLGGLRDFTLNVDEPIHLNQISVAPSDGQYWQRGDLLLSSRHLSALFLYRPSTNRVLWHGMGPWMNQHSARFLDDHRISIFDNNSLRIAGREGFLHRGDTNRVLVYDFETGTVSEPFAALLAQARPVTRSEGLARLLPDGGLFVEETNQRRLLRFSADRLLWSFVNDYDASHIGAVSWSRYLTAGEAAVVLPALQQACGAAHP